jgi:uncharacterized surface protein with fasciclin (FAS1) repeats
MYERLFSGARALTLAAAALVVVGCNESSPTEAPTTNLVATAQAAGQFTTLLAALDAAGLRQELEQGGPYTVFAPTDAAFAALPPGTVEGLLQDTEALRAVLLFHVVSGQVNSSQAATLSAAPTLNGANVAIQQVGGQLRVGGATVVQADIGASNGIIHVIDAVLIP